jgi:peptide/nickel transport system ATP-binding protein
VKYLSERVLVMLDGKIVESGDTISTLQNPKKEYTKKLMSAVYEI